MSPPRLLPSSWPKSCHLSTRRATCQSNFLGAGLAILFLVRYLRSNDEREQQINYRELAFYVYPEGLVFSALQPASCKCLDFIPCPWLGIPALMISLWSLRIDSLLVAAPMKTRLRVLRAEKEWSQAELAAHVGVARGTISAIETGKYDPESATRFQDCSHFWQDHRRSISLSGKRTITGDQSESLTQETNTTMKYRPFLTSSHPSLRHLIPDFPV